MRRKDLLGDGWSGCDVRYGRLDNHAVQGEHRMVSIAVRSSGCASFKEGAMEKSEVSSGESLRLINLDAVARWLGVSHRHIYRLVDRGAMPKPVRLGVAVRWDSEVIRSWIDSGCPAVEPRKKRPR